jgi:hypothetical protein
MKFRAVIIVLPVLLFPAPVMPTSATTCRSGSSARGSCRFSMSMIAPAVQPLSLSSADARSSHLDGRNDASHHAPAHAAALAITTGRCIMMVPPALECPSCFALQIKDRDRAQKGQH